MEITEVVTCPPGRPGISSTQLLWWAERSARIVACIRHRMKLAVRVTTATPLCQETAFDGMMPTLHEEDKPTMAMNPHGLKHLPEEMTCSASRKSTRANSPPGANRAEASQAHKLTLTTGLPFLAWPGERRHRRGHAKVPTRGPPKPPKLGLH